MNPLAFLTGNWPRILVWGAVAAAVLTVTWMHGYTRGEIKLYEYQAKEATQAVTVVLKIKEVDHDALAGLQRDYDDLRVRYDAAKRAKPLGAAAGAGACHDPATGSAGVQRDGDQAGGRVRDAARMLDDVEAAVLGILGAGDTEIAKLRRLYQRDVEASEAKP